MQRRTAFLWIFLVVVAVTGTELLSHMALRALLGGAKGYARSIRMEQAVVQDPYVDPYWLLREDELPPADHTIIHPYLGYVRAPDQRVVNFGDTESLEPYGFATGSIVRRRQADTVVVGVFGGSVAENMMNDHAAVDHLSAAIRISPQYAGKKIVYTVGALAGY